MKSDINKWRETQRKSRLKYAQKLKNTPRKSISRVRHSDRVRWKNKAIEAAKHKVREEAQGICCKCEKWTKVLHGSHVMRVSYEATAADTDNIMPMCYYCHFNWWHKYPLEASDWFKKKWPGRYERLQKKAQTNPDYTAKDWESIYKELISSAE